MHTAKPLGCEPEHPGTELKCISGSWACYQVVEYNIVKVVEDGQTTPLQSYSFVSSSRREKYLLDAVP